MQAVQQGWQISEDGGLFRVRFTAMASPCEFLIDGASARQAEQLAEQGTQETWRIERKFSRYRSGNIVDQINTAQGQAIRIDGETARLLAFAQQAWQLSDGQFDLSSGILRRVWKFDGSDRIPRPEQVSALLPLIGWDKIRWDEHSIQMPAGMQIDFGGIGKEYAVDRVLERLIAKTDAVVLVNFGGDLRCSGPRKNGESWKVGIETLEAPQDQSGTDQADTLLQLLGGALATSGDARRYLLKNGRRYAHVLNPKTGWPVIDPPRAVTVAADTCSEAGLLASLAMLQGPQAESFLQEQGLRYWIRTGTP